MGGGLLAPRRVISAFLILLLLVVPASAAAQESSLGEPTLWLDPARPGDTAETIQDLSGQSNHGELLNFSGPESDFVGAGTAEDPRALHFDGVDDLVVTSAEMPVPTDLTLALWFRTTTPGGKLAGFENRRSGMGTQFDRHLYLSDDGRLHFGVWIGRPALVSTSDSVADGRWHFAVATLSWDGTRSQMALYLDGEAVDTLETSGGANYLGWWRLGGGNFSNWTPKPTNDYFKGDLGPIRLYAQSLPAAEVASLYNKKPGVSPTPPPASALPRVDAWGGIEQGNLVLQARLTGIPNAQRTRLFVVRDDGTEWAVGPVAEEMTWSGPPQTGKYRLEARETTPGGGTSIVAAASVLAFAPVAAASQIAGAVATGLAVMGTFSFAVARGFDLQGFLRRIFTGFLADKMRDRTKRLLAWRLPSWVAAVLALILMALFVVGGKPGSLAPRTFLQGLLVAGVATVVFKGITILGGALLAQVARREPRYFLWTAGTVTLAVTSLALHSPFGYTGYLESQRNGKRPDPARAARGALATLGLNAALAGIFLALGLLTQLSFAEAGISLALGAVAVSALPFPTLVGNAIWKWSRAAGAVAGIVGFVPYVFFQSGLLPAAVIWALAAAGAGAFLAAVVETVLRTRRPTPSPAPASA